MSPAGAAERLSVHVLEKRWADGRPVLGDIRFTLGAGQVAAISGPSGCGKSTLMGIVAGLDTDFHGSVTWQRTPRLGMVFQSPRLLPWRTAAENVALAIGGRRAAHRRAVDALAEVGLADVADVYPSRLSLGMARRVALARALIIEPDVLLLDEAFVSLDDVAAERVRSCVLAAVSGRGTSVLMVSHDSRETLLMADRRLVLGGTPARLVGDEESLRAEAAQASPPV